MTEFFKKVTKTDIRHILAIMVTVGCFILLYLMQVKEIPQANKDVVNIVCGFVFGGGFNSVMGYFFGSSKTETKKENE